MPALTCNSCNKEFQDDAEQKLHYKSDWHRYNLKRKVSEHGIGHCAITGAVGSDEGDETDEQIRCGGYADKNRNEE